MNIRAFALAVLLALSAASAFADGVVDKLMTPADKTRLANYAQTRQTALREARAGGDAAEVKQLDAVLARPILPFSGFDLVGGWQCRTIKVGGNLPLVIYGWFKCKVTDDGSGWMLQKLTGSQRTKGRFYDESDKRLIYLGSSFIAGDSVKPYGSGKATDQVGYAFHTGKREWRIEFPAPELESKLDIIEFRR